MKMKLKHAIGKKVVVFIDTPIVEESIKGCTLESINYDGIVVYKEQQNGLAYEFIPMDRIVSINWNVKKIEEENENENKT